MSITIKYINLGYRFDRRAEFIRAWSRFPIRLERFDAVDTNNPHGCAMSHKAVITEHDFSQQPILIVAEDDAVPTDDFEKNFMKVIRWMVANPGKWDIVSFGVSDIGYVSPINDELVSTDRILCAHFTAYNSKILDYIHNFNPNPEEPYKVENAYDRWLAGVPLKKVVTHPFLSIQRPSFSDLAHKKQDFTSIFNKVSDDISRSRKLIIDLVKESQEFFSEGEE